MDLPRILYVIWFTNFPSKVKTSHFLQTLAWSNPILTKLAHRYSTYQVCTQAFTNEISGLFTLWLPIALWSSPLSLQFSVLFLTVCFIAHLVGSGKRRAQTQPSIKSLGIELAPLKVKVDLREVIPPSLPLFSGHCWIWFKSWRFGVAIENQNYL